MGDRALLWLHHRPIARAVSSAPLVTGAFYSEAAPFGSCVTGAASHIGNKFGQMGVDLLREFRTCTSPRLVLWQLRMSSQSLRSQRRSSALEAVFGRDGCGHHLSRRLSAPFWGNTGGFGAYLIVLRKRFAMTLHILGIAVEETDNPQPECKANPVDQFWLAASFLWGL